MSKYSDETKAAVMAALLTGQSVSSVAKEYKIPPGTVSSWKNRNLKEHIESMQENASEKTGILLIDHLHQNIRTLTAVNKFVESNDEWKMKQSASDLAVFTGVLSDKTFRLIEALGNAPDDNTP